MIVAMGSVFSWVLTYARIPQILGLWMGSLTNNPTILLLLIALLVIITGMFVDTTACSYDTGTGCISDGRKLWDNPFQVAVVVVVGIGNRDADSTCCTVTLHYKLNWKTEAGKANKSNNAVPAGRSSCIATGYIHP